MLKYWIYLMVFLSLTSCMKEYDVYNDTSKDISEYFDFTTSRNVKLSLNYGFTGYSFLFEVYTKNPFDENYSQIEDLEPIYMAYTDKNSAFEGEVMLPAYADKIYIYSKAIGVPECLELNVNNGSAAYCYQFEGGGTKAVTSGKKSIPIRANKRTIVPGRFYALYNEFLPASGSYYWETRNFKVQGLYSTIRNNEQLSDKSTLGQLLGRLNANLKKKNNSNLVCNEKDINISIATSVNGEPVNGVHLDLVYLKSSATMNNAIAYYYYKSNATMTAQAIRNLPKFVVLPRTTSTNPSKTIKVRLQYFGEDGLSKEGTDLFPAGYTVGWMLVADLFPYDGSYFYWTNLTNIENRIIWASNISQTIYSNQSANYKQKAGCLSLYDEDSKRVIVGFEDHSFHDSRYDDRSLEDVLFYIDADPVDAINIKEKPDIPDDKEEVLTTERTSGTYVYEDLWPTGGDYDMNDVIVEYGTEITFNNKNEIKKIVDIFTPVHNGAIFKNAFGYVIKNVSQLGNIKRDESDIAALEENNQLIVFEDAAQAVTQKKSYQVVREFTSNYPKKNRYKKEYNPFIVVDYKTGKKGRIEVHLPKEKATSWANLKLQNQKDDAYYINKNGKYPFALQIEGVANFKPVTEGKTIGSNGEYSKFNSWVESNGQSNSDWFLHK